jgi:hypothetical protein
MLHKKIHSGSMALRKMAGKLPGVGIVSGTIKAVKKHPIAATLGVLGIGAIPGIYRNWRTAISESSPHNPKNMFPSNYWERQ